ncbi:hypothetical protein VPH35_021697 [Triticum aestivum]
MLREHRWVQAAVLSSQVEENSAYSWMAHPPATESHLPPPAGHPRVVCGSRPSFGSSEHLRGAPAMQATYLSPISATRSHRLRTASSWILLISLSPTHMRGTDIVSYDSFRHPVVLLPSATPCGIWFKLQDFAIHGVDAGNSSVQIRTMNLYPSMVWIHYGCRSSVNVSEKASPMYYLHDTFFPVSLDS